MTALWQQAAIVLLVLLAAGYVLWTLLSLRYRQRLLDGLAARGIAAGWAERHRLRLASPGCGNCPAAGASLSAKSHHTGKPVKPAVKA